MRGMKPAPWARSPIELLPYHYNPKDTKKMSKEPKNCRKYPLVRVLPSREIALVVDARPKANGVLVYLPEKDVQAVALDGQFIHLSAFKSAASSHAMWISRRAKSWHVHAYGDKDFPLTRAGLIAACKWAAVYDIAVQDATLIVLDNGAQMPTRAHSTDVGYDVRATSVSYQLDKSFDKGGRIVRYECGTGLHICPPRGYHFELLANSRIAKMGLVIPNGIGLIDPDYTGEIKVFLVPAAGVPLRSLKEAQISRGDVVGQLVLRKTHDAAFCEVPALLTTERGNGGFGSTDEKGAKA